MRKTMFSLSLPLLAAAIFLLTQAVPAECLTAEDVKSYVDAAKALNLNGDNLKIGSESAEEILKDDHFMALLRGRLRIARLLKAASDAEGGEGTYALHVEAGPIVAFLCQGGAPTLDRLVQGAVEQVVKPLQLEATLKELPRYYEAIVATADWQKKFGKIMGEGEYPSIQRGKIFHIAGFPEIGDKPYYTAAMDIELKDDTMYLSEWDASAEGWLYSFWMRRWREGTMETAKIAVDLLNKALGQ
ncbi:hypothetical protein [Fretibacterium fastidiosum]|uniref:Uncharacterized protein n=1 Tax=Fretibacterium fastidiosum TaxID=651822 RepID=A0AB94IVG1_9BACT|nr:hypothetical protein [Fretibacterium fastidiosum]CBL27730.1 hypothetical protein SY1_01920 [Fretibacterium fastidiosum]